MSKQFSNQAQTAANTITRLSTALLMLAVVSFFFSCTISYYVDTQGTIETTDDTVDGLILGVPAYGDKNLLNIPAIGALFAMVDVVLLAITLVCSGLSFAAVCFDESRNIWFRVLAVAALMCIMFGGLGV